MRTFTMFRRNVPDATHNALQKNPPDQPQFEGVVWSDGTCAIRWMTARGSTAVWNCLDDMLAIHGHPEYESELIWDDARQAITAAAGVEPVYGDTLGNLQTRSQIEARTLEYCAQLADAYETLHTRWRGDLSAAIRAKKEKPIDPNLQYPGKDPDFVFPEE